MTRYCTRRYIPRAPHPSRTERVALRHDSIHHIRSLLLCRIFLSLLPLKPSPDPRTRWVLTTNGYYYPRPIRSAPTEHGSSLSLRSHRYLGPPQPYRRGAKTGNPVTWPNDSTRLLLHLLARSRVLRRPLYHRGRGLRFNFLCSHRIPRSACYHRIHIPSSLLCTSSTVPLHLKPPFRVRGSRLILTLR